MQYFWDIIRTVLRKLCRKDIEKTSLRQDFMTNWNMASFEASMHNILVNKAGDHKCNPIGSTSQK